nr:hypothetical protein [uncultured Celeribacter sp.]
MRVRDEKGGKEFEVYCPEKLRETIAATPKAGAFVLSKNLTEPLGYDAIESAFRKWRASIGDDAKKYVLHGLRKLAIVLLAGAGRSDAEIQAGAGQSAEMVAYYRKMASRKALSKNAMTRRRTKTE